MENQSIFYLLLFVTVLNRFCSAGYCTKSYGCTGTCYRQASYKVNCGFLGLDKCTRYKIESYICGKTCYRQECCTNYTGSRCTTPLCSGSKSCPNGGTCVSPNLCSSCNTGYASPNCSDINECNAGTSGCKHKCSNTLGSFKCYCLQGFRLHTDGKTCLDIDECRIGTSSCQHNCTNTPGNYICFCKDGYSLATNKQDCKDIDECSADPPPCEHDCHNTEGSFSCTCQEGYELGTDGHTCTECSVFTYGMGCSNSCGSCKNNSTCDSVNGYCHDGCMAGYTGDLCKAQKASSENQSGENKLVTYAAVGGSAAFVGIVAIVAVCLFCWWKRKQPRKEQDKREKAYTDLNDYTPSPGSETCATTKY